MSFAAVDALVSLAVDGTDLRVDPLPDDAGTGEIEVVTRADGGSDLLVVPDAVTIRGEGLVVGDVVACGDLLVWPLGDDAAGGTARLMVLDRAAGRLWRVGEANPFGSVQCAGDLISYTRLDPDPLRFADTIVFRWTA